MNILKITTNLFLIVFFSTSCINSPPKLQENPPIAISKIHVVRSQNNPLITFDSDRTLGKNINGPSLIKVPDWIQNPLGKYYMYFANHNGRYIRLAYADSLNGKWHIYKQGTLKLNQAELFKGHIASPDVHIDHEKQEIIMYFHGPVKKRKGQFTGLATSKNGLDFYPSNEILGKFYFRVFKWGKYYYAIAKNGDTGWGELYRSRDGRSPFESRGDFISKIRHSALYVMNNYLLVFYSRVGDAPERIVVASIQLDKDWDNWIESKTMDVIFPELEYEGINYSTQPSVYGSAIEVCQLRDPYVFEEDGDLFLFYTIAGEMGIAMAEINIQFEMD